MKDNIVKLMGIVMLIVETLAKIKPTDPLRLDNHTTIRKRNWSDSSGNSPAHWRHQSHHAQARKANGQSHPRHDPKCSRHMMLYVCGIILCASRLWAHSRLAAPLWGCECSHWTLTKKLEDLSSTWMTPLGSPPLSPTMVMMSWRWSGKCRWFYYGRIKKGEGQGVKMSRWNYDVQWNRCWLKMKTHHVPFSQMIHTNRYIQMIYTHRHRRWNHGRIKKGEDQGTKNVTMKLWYTVKTMLVKNENTSCVS